MARIDFRLDASGKIYFIECNPLPGLTPGWSDLCLIAAAAGMDYRTLIGEILAGAIRRYKERERERRVAKAEARHGAGGVAPANTAPAANATPSSAPAANAAPTPAPAANATPAPAPDPATKAG